MLPKNYYGKGEGETHGDASWILERIGMLPIAMQGDVTDRYSHIFFKMKEEGDRGFRRRANLWLLRTTEKNKATHTNDGTYF